MSKPIRVISDGTHLGTKIFVGDEQVSNVQSVTWQFGMKDPKPIITLTLKRSDVDLVGELPE